MLKRLKFIAAFVKLKKKMPKNQLADFYKMATMSLR